MEEGYMGLCHAHVERKRRGLVAMDTPVHRTPEARFWARVDKDGPLNEHRPELGPCWIWTGGVAGNLNYPKYGRTSGQQAHRFSYELLVGPVPADLDLDHLCRTSLCVNPAHLEPVTHLENIMRGESLPALNARKTHCQRGHEFTPENTGQMSSGGRSCITCDETIHTPRKLLAVRLKVSRSTLPWDPAELAQLLEQTAPLRATAHGLRSTYVNHRCRCPECTAANSTYSMTLKSRLAEAS